MVSCDVRTRVLRSIFVCVLVCETWLWLCRQSGMSSVSLAWHKVTLKDYECHKKGVSFVAIHPAWLIVEILLSQKIFVLCMVCFRKMFFKCKNSFLFGSIDVQFDASFWNFLQFHFNTKMWTYSSVQVLFIGLLLLSFRSKSTKRIISNERLQ